MRTEFKFLLTSAFIFIICARALSQSDDFEQLSSAPKRHVDFPIDYKILRPRLAAPDWDQDYDKFYSFLTPVLRKTQAAMSVTKNGVVSSFIPNAIMTHAQLDTNTIAKDPVAIVGTWRMLSYRSIQFNDSVDIHTKEYYRLKDTVLNDKSKDEVFAVFTDDHLKLYARESGKSKFKNVMSSKYQIESGRYIMLYKMAKASAGVSQFGIDENGYLILNYPKVIENVKQGEYFSYYAVIEQYIFEKVR